MVRVKSTVRSMSRGLGFFNDGDDFERVWMNVKWIYALKLFIGQVVLQRELSLNIETLICLCFRSGNGCFSGKIRCSCIY